MNKDRVTITTPSDWETRPAPRQEEPLVAPLERCATFPVFMLVRARTHMRFSRVKCWPRDVGQRGQFQRGQLVVRDLSDSYWPRHPRLAKSRARQVPGQRCYPNVNALGSERAYSIARRTPRCHPEAHPRWNSLRLKRTHRCPQTHEPLQTRSCRDSSLALACQLLEWYCRSG